MNILRVFVVNFLFLSFAVAQEPPKAVLVDEITGMDCEVLWARLDAFMNEMSNTPSSIATVEISGKVDDARGNFYWDHMIRGYFSRRSIPKERWQVVRGPLGNERVARFWMSPPGGSPAIESAEWTMNYPTGIKPFVFTYGESYMVEVGVCLYVNEIALLAMALETNSMARLNVVINALSNAEFNRRKRNVINELVRDYSISRSRIRIFKKLRSKRNPFGREPTVEYWLLP